MSAETLGEFRYRYIRYICIACLSYIHDDVNYALASFPLAGFLYVTIPVAKSSAGFSATQTENAEKERP